ncbi:hypothetical protein JOD45_002241 [Scopulibacillus daqui]|uniref:Uncharacterized protein n=1 Tax=Scopulibacillus daqui TaxID=1469162 RepID=A0ABS2Q1B9_9BACL|nr:hypothetical protein [Scopulibacillus daqui]MBM7646016.1 hypothetical protein [Scopulibacillus daqui]
MDKMNAKSLQTDEIQLANDVKIVPHDDYYELRVRGIKLKLTPKQFELAAGENNK